MSARLQIFQPLFQCFELFPGLLEHGALGIEFFAPDQVHAFEGAGEHGAELAFQFVPLLGQARRQRLAQAAGQFIYGAKIDHI